MLRLASWITLWTLSAAVPAQCWGGQPVRSKGSHPEPAPTPAVVQTDGSSTSFAALSTLTKAFQATSPDIKILHTMSSSARGIESLLTASADIARTSRPLHLAESRAAAQTQRALKVFQFGYSGIVIIAHPSKGDVLKSITSQQLRDIFFTGKIQNWETLDPRLKGQIQPYIRDPAHSGTAELFNEVIGGRTSVAYVDRAIQTLDPSELIDLVANDRDGISYSDLLWVDSRVRALAFGQERNSAVFPTRESIRNQTYPFSRGLFLVIDSEAQMPTLRFVNFVLSNEGQKLLDKTGIMPVQDGAP